MIVSVKSGVTTEEGDFGLFWLRSLIRSAEVGVRLAVAFIQLGSERERPDSSVDSPMAASYFWAFLFAR